MTTHQGKAAAALALGLGLAGTTAFAQTGARSQGVDPNAGSNAATPGAESGVLGSTQQGSTAPAPVPQYWLADASLFIANAGNAAQTLATEQSLGVQAPSVLGNQAQFLLAATNRALSSLTSLQSNAEATNPAAVPEIRSAIGQLVAAQAQANQTLEAATSGTLGPLSVASMRSAYGHLQSAERSLQGIGRAYNAQNFVTASACPLYRGIGGRGMGVGIGGAGRAPGGAPHAPSPGTSPGGTPGGATPGGGTPGGATPGGSSPGATPGGQGPTPGGSSPGATPGGQGSTPGGSSPSATPGGGPGSNPGDKGDKP